MGGSAMFAEADYEQGQMSAIFTPPEKVTPGFITVFKQLELYFISE